jgi:predicted RNA binding protein YcfA (HicA-like mRNA interferase family)
VKRRDLLKELSKAGCVLHRHGSGHDIYLNPKNGRKAPVPRHTEIKNTMLEVIKKQLGI